MFRVVALSMMSLALVSAQGGPSGNPPTAAEMVQRRVDMLARRLSLTDAQKTQATTIFTDAANATSAARTNLKAANDAIQAAVKTNDVGTINSQAIAAGTLIGQITAADRKAEAAFYAILTADQKTKYDRRGPGGFGPGGPGFGGPGGPRGPRGGDHGPHQEQ